MPLVRRPLAARGKLLCSINYDDFLIHEQIECDVEGNCAQCLPAFGTDAGEYRAGDGHYRRRWPLLVKCVCPG
ncbi:hypothetical protein XHV734_0494 [Xanthomonas hortorum pv. vitians]|nr:hypothetical protein XHV734_0494 [Xanthomonas hortorum pv. vitians]